MGTKMALHSTRFLDALTHRQLLLSLVSSMAFAVAAGVVAAAEASRSLVVGAPSWWVTLVASIVVPVAVSLTYARRAGDLEDETLGCVDVGTLPRGVPAGPAADLSRTD